MATIKCSVIFVLLLLSSVIVLITDNRIIMSKKVWATSEDGLIEYVSLTKELLEPAIKTMHQSFYIGENICVAFDMPSQPECYPEMDTLLIDAARDGVSIVARDKLTGKIAGAAFNKIQIKGSPSCNQQYLKKCKYPATRGVIQWMVEMENIFDIFDNFKVDCVMEIMFVGTSPDFRKRGIAKKLFEVSVDIARKLKQGHNVKVPINNEPLDSENPPQIVTAICTSFITQKVSRDLNFQPATMFEFDKFTHNGKSLGKIITNTAFITYEYIKI